MKKIIVVLLGISIMGLAGCGSKIEGRYGDPEGDHIIFGPNGKATLLTRGSPPTEEALSYEVSGNTLKITGPKSGFFHKETEEFTVMGDGSLKESDGTLFTKQTK